MLSALAALTIASVCLPAYERIRTEPEWIWERRSEALELVQEVRACVGDEPSAVLDQLIGLEAVLLSEERDFEQLLAFGEQYIDRFRQNVSAEHYARFIWNYTYSLSEFGRYFEAEAVLLDAYQRLSVRHQPFYVSGILIELATLSRLRTDYATARRYVELGLEIADRYLWAHEHARMRSEFLVQRFLIADMELPPQPNRAEALVAVFEQDLPALEEAFSTYERLRSFEYPLVQCLHAFQGRAHWVRGRVDEARTSLRKAVDMDEYRQISCIIDPMIDLSWLEWNEGNRDLALATLSGFTSEMEADPYHLPGFLAYLRLELARMLELAGDYAGAARVYDRAIAQTDDQQPFEQRLGSLGSMTSNGIVVRVGGARVDAFSGNLPQALSRISEVSGLYYRSHQALVSFSRQQQGTPAYLEMNRLLGRRSALLRSLQQSSSLDAMAELFQVDVEINALTGSPPPAEPLDISEIQQRLRLQGAAMLVYSTATEQEALRPASRSYVVVVLPDTLHMVELPATESRVTAALLQASPVLLTGEPASASDRFFNLEGLHALYADLMLPVEPYVEGVQRLVLVPDMPLSTVPFAALVRRPVRSHAYGQAEYVMDRWALQFELSPQFYLRPEREQRGAAQVLAAGVSRFSGRYPDLPYVRTELRLLDETLHTARILREEEATVDRVLEEIREASVVHLATHAVLSDAYLQFNGLALSPSDRFPDGHLYLHDLLHQALDNELVVLSGCNTARGPTGSTEGMFGLHWAIRAAGARSSMASLWVADDAALVPFTEALYAELAQGTPRDVALQRAQMEVRLHDPRFASPFFWASMALFGESTPVEGLVSRRTFTPFPIAWSALVVLVLLSILAWRRFYSK